MKRYLYLLMLTGNAYINGATCPTAINLEHKLTPQNISDGLLSFALVDKVPPHTLLTAINSTNINNFTAQNIADVLWALDRIEIVRHYPTIFDAVQEGNINVVTYFLKNGSIYITLDGSQIKILFGSMIYILPYKLLSKLKIY
jgi:hypothetical protein